MTTQELLDEAIAARHSLLTGAQEASIRDPSGRQVQYTPANISALERYIAELRRTIAQVCPTRNRIIYAIPD